QRCQLEIAEPSNRNYKSSDEYQRTYDKFVRYGRGSLYPDEMRALTLSSDPSLGYAVPQSWETQFVTALSDANIFRSLCKVIKTDSDRHIPIVTSDATAYWTNEGGSYTASDITLAQATLGSHKLTSLVLASEELAYDVAFNLAGFIAESFGRSFGDAEETALLSGTGPSQPTGILSDATLGKTAASSTVVYIDEILDLVHSLGRPYRKRAVFVMNDSTLKQIRKLKDGDGRYFYQESLQAGEPSTLFGSPVYISSAMPEATAGNTAILWGDFSYVWLADRQGIYLQELRELYAATGQIGYRCSKRIDSKLILPEAVKKLVMKA
ncbi:MAG: phage major capsid protein, partial [Desulfamplus sp.]|nr:phage major capsid protein [Desulfamplus sp.]